MFLKSPLSLAPASGFVAFDGGGAVDHTDSYRAAAKAPLVAWQPAAPGPAQPLAADIDAHGADGLLQSSTWQPVAGRRARRVEGAVIIAICVYFLVGFASAAGWL
jgi:hypothetical protein